MRQPFQHLCVFYFILATQCQSMDSGATIATDPSFQTTNPSIEQTIKMDPVTPMDSATDHINPKETLAAMTMSSAPSTVDNNQNQDIPVLMMTRGAPVTMVQRTTALAPSVKKTTAGKTTSKKLVTTARTPTKGGAKPATLSPTTKLKTVSNTAAKRVMTSQSKVKK
jgi:hypothetical protein